MCPFDVIAAAEPAIGEIAAWQALQPTTGAVVVDIDRDHDQLARRAGHLHIVGWTEAGIRHLHHPCLRVGGGGPWLFWRFAVAALGIELLSLALDLSQRSLRGLHPLAALARRALFSGPD